MIVTFLAEPEAADLASRGITPGEATDLRQRLNGVADDWERPEMDVYDAL